MTPYIGGVAQPVVVFDSPATTQTVTGLANGTSYTFAVAAINAIGTGPAGFPSNEITPLAANPPNAPAVAEVVAVDDHDDAAAVSRPRCP